MAKVIVVVTGTQVQNDEAIISYSVSIIKIGGAAFSYSSDYKINTALTVTANLNNLRKQIITQAVEKGHTVMAEDVIVFGGPV